MNRDTPRITTHRPDMDAPRFEAGAPVAEVRVEAPEPAPTLPEMASNFAAGAERWGKYAAQHGVKASVVAREVFEARLAACESCPKGYWDGRARLGLGKCSAPGCGCTKLKHWLTTERCPINAWPPL